MSNSVNKVILLGTLGKDTEMRFTPSGSAVTTFSMATENVYRDNNGETQKET